MTAPQTPDPSGAGRSGRAALFCVLVVALAWSMAFARHNYALHTFEHAGTWALHDEGAQSLTPLLIARGKVPYRDFEPRHTPLSYYVFALGYRLLGVDLVSLRWVLALANAATAVLAFVLARMTGARRWAWLAPLAALAWGVHEYNVAVPRWLAVPASLGSLYFLMRNAPTPQTKDILVSGLWAAVTLLTAQNTGVFLVAAGVWSLSLWACNQSGDERPPVWTAFVPVVSSAIAAGVLAKLVWVRGVSPPWMLYAGPGIVFTCGLALLATTRRPSTKAAVRLAGHVTLLGTATVVPTLGVIGWWSRQSGFEPILRSLQAGAGSLHRIYTLDPPPPPYWFAGAVALWVAAAAALSAPVPSSPDAGRRRAHAVTGMLSAAVLVLAVMWLPAVEAASAIQGVVGVLDKLLGFSMMHLWWLVGAAAIVVGMRDVLKNQLTQPRAVGACAGLATMTSWIHLHPWADYTHILWTAPLAGIALASLSERGVQQLRLLDGVAPGERRLRLSVGFAVLPLLYAVAMLVKWGGYYLDYELSFRYDKPVVREFRLLDTQTANIYVDTQTEADWQKLLAFIRDETARDAPVLGVPYFPLVNVLADRPFPLYDCFWWPDFTGEVRVRQRDEVLAAVTEASIPLIVGPSYDETYFSLDVLQKTWPDVWAELNDNYRRTAVFGPYWVYQPKE